MRAIWHGEVPLIEDLDSVFERQEEEKIDHLRQTIREYEKEIEHRGAEIVDKERTQAERADGGRLQSIYRRQKPSLKWKRISLRPL